MMLEKRVDLRPVSTPAPRPPGARWVRRCRSSPRAAVRTHGTKRGALRVQPVCRPPAPRWRPRSSDSIRPLRLEHVLSQRLRLGSQCTTGWGCSAGCRAQCREEGQGLASQPSPLTVLLRCHPSHP
uniref:Uncharacterized protein n=1 Tax=Myotis myotis TaxID=51298 RepID=A0A7J7QW02_MYOMY|nr:hypothetical protein mMyoMyo1_011297 [Myotis myotis]